MLREIGSEFWNAEPKFSNEEFLLSGRTALDFIIRDILKQKNVDSVMLPSYCCHTMIEPFMVNKINVRFYDVYFDNENGLCADIPEAIQNELFYHISYFGFSKLSNVDWNRIKNTYSVVIDDRTHSCMSENQYENCDYYFESYRKWSGFYGIAKAVKMGGNFLETPQGSNETYISLRKKAFELKKQYMEFGQGDKKEFFSLFGEAETLLETDYKGYCAPNESIKQLIEFDTESIKKARRSNAEILICELKNTKGINLMFNELSYGDTPLFVPIIADKNRDSLRNYLIDNKIYCPVHWPNSDYHTGISERAKRIYGSELSLLCDQRYNSNDMLRIASVIKKFGCE